jgi:hypothetical protein
MIVHAPLDQLMKLQGNTADGGHVDEKSRVNGRKASVYDDSFASILSRAREHKENDRDEDGRCCDGALVFSENGLLMRAMIKFVCGVTKYTWANHGTRHDSAFAVATLLERGLVFVASEAGEVHLITASSARAGVAYKLPTEAPATAESNTSVMAKPANHVERPRTADVSCLSACLACLPSLCAPKRPRPTRPATLEAMHM